MQVVKKQSTVYGAIRFYGTNLNEVKNFVPENILQLKNDPISTIPLVFINGNKVNIGNYIINLGDNNYKIYESIEFERTFKILDSKKGEREEFISININGIKMFNGCKSSDHYEMIDIKTGYQFSESFENIKKFYINITNLRNGEANGN